MNISHHHSQSKWSTDFCDCASNPATCFITCCLPCVTFGQIAEMLDEGQSSCAAQGCIYCALWLVSCHWVYACMFREKLRARYGLLPDPCNDCCVHCCCHGCALCQEHAELKHRGLDPTIGWIGPPNVPSRMPPSMHRV
ncbi:cell number regulator 2-like [Bidens hawaiensis]|uniref:cell number regulator 2-like n=1 Tax=Bidens hawaiensis TaxID=980011 RepID=UPI00404A2D2B